MTRFTIAVCFVLLCAFCTNARVSKGINVSRNMISVSSWELGERAPRDMEVSFSVAMKQSNFPKLKQIFDQVSTPSSKVRKIKPISNYKQLNM